MIVDLHSHFPMHLLAGDADTVKRMTDKGGASLGAKLRTAVLRLANKVANYPKGNKPAVTIQTLSDSTVRVALSMLYAPFDEIDPDQPYGAPPLPRYFQSLLDQIKLVDTAIAAQTGTPKVVVAHDKAQLAKAQAANQVALIHAVEGGFHLGDNEADIRKNVKTLADNGVAYITVAHLFWRQVATNSPAIPFLPDSVYSVLCPQPSYGLTRLGVAAITAMKENHILVDVTHMSESSIDETLRLLDQLDPDGKVPLMATHSACRAIAKGKYNLKDEHIAGIARRGGVIGLIACKHWMAAGLKEPKTFADTMDIICRHIDHIHDVTNDVAGAHQFSAFGSDQDGFIKPSLPELDTPGAFQKVQQELEARYDKAIARQICSENALRVLQYWG